MIQARDHVYSTPSILAAAFADYLVQYISVRAWVHIALSGGSTPKLLFAMLSEVYKDKINWSKVHLYWGDERCVPPYDDQSNYKMTKELLIDHVDIPEYNIHRVNGSIDPHIAVQEYRTLLEKNLRSVNTIPVFDMVILGMGEDGHTASIFPHEMHILTSDNLCEVATHPTTGQQRISLTGRFINAALERHFLVAGANKAAVIKEIKGQEGHYEAYPASYIQDVDWWMDYAAAGIAQS